MAIGGGGGVEMCPGGRTGTHAVGGACRTSDDDDENLHPYQAQRAAPHGCAARAGST